MNRVAIVLVLLAACKSEESKKRGRAALDKADQALARVDQMELDDLKESIAAVKDKLTSGDDPFSKCVVGMAMAKRATVEGSKPLVTELTTLCEHDVPLANATRAVVAAEKERAARQPGDVLSECFTADWDGAVKLLDAAAPPDPAWTALKDRWAKACPP